MNKVMLNVERSVYRRLKQASDSSRVAQLLSSALAFVTHEIRQAVKSFNVNVDYVSNDEAATGLGGKRNDRWRQALNVIFAVGQAVTTFVVVALGADDAINSNEAATTPLVPAGYAFAIWGLIYGSTIAYSVYQAQPRQRNDPLLRSIGWWTAPAFLGTSLWLFAASNEWYWTTVAVFFGILVALLGAFIQFIRYNAPRTNAERYLVVLPISVYTGWASVATVANTSTALQATGFSNMLFADTIWAVMMLLVAGVIGSFVTYVSKGNVSYALTVVWALVGIVVANVFEAPNVAVATTAGCMAVAVVLVLLVAQQRTRIMPTNM